MNLYVNTISADGTVGESCGSAEEPIQKYKSLSPKKVSDFLMAMNPL
jgi:hypothetical protein